MSNFKYSELFFSFDGKDLCSHIDCDYFELHDIGEIVVVDGAKSNLTHWNGEKVKVLSYEMLSNGIVTSVVFNDKLGATTMLPELLKKIGFE